MISRSSWKAPWTTEEIRSLAGSSDANSPVFYYLVLGQEKVLYSTGYEYKRNDYVYAKYGVLNGGKDTVTFKGVRIYRDYASKPLNNGVSGDTYYELLHTNKGNTVCGIYQSPKRDAAQVAMHFDANGVVTSIGGYNRTTFDKNKMYLSPVRGFTTSTSWPVIHAYNNILNTVADGTALCEIIMNPTAQTYTYKYVSRGTTVKTGSLVLGANPTAPTNPATYDDGNYRYTFSKWNLTYSGDDRTYTAAFTSKRIVMTVKYVVEGTVKQTSTYNKGDAVPAYTGATPTKASSTTQDFTFKSWSSSISGDVNTMTATWTATTIVYTRIWKNYDGTVLQTKTYNAGTTAPNYTGSTPTKPDDNYRYTFSSWSSSTSGRTTTYTATFTSARIVITVIWKNGSTQLQKSTYNKGESEPSYTGATPTKASTTNYDYTFSSWSKSTSGDTITYTAQFDSERMYRFEVYIGDPHSALSSYEIREITSSKEMLDDMKTSLEKRFSQDGKSIRYNSSYGTPMTTYSFVQDSITDYPNTDCLQQTVQWKLSTSAPSLSSDKKSIVWPSASSTYASQTRTKSSSWDYSTYRRRSLPTVPTYFWTGLDYPTDFNTAYCVNNVDNPTILYACHLDIYMRKNSWQVTALDGKIYAAPTFLKYDPSDRSVTRWNCIPSISYTYTKGQKLCYTRYSWDYVSIYVNGWGSDYNDTLPAIGEERYADPPFGYITDENGTHYDVYDIIYKRIS